MSASKVTYSARRQLSRVKQWLGELPSAMREKLQQMVLSQRDQRALGIGQFRLSGELHQWMYDRFSLSRLMVNSGFISPVAKNTAESSILGWGSYHLDEDSAGKPYKPDLIFVEAIKP